MKYLHLSGTLLVLFLAGTATAVEPPLPFGPVPSSRQMTYHRELDGFYAFCHWSLNAWTDREWGQGGEDPTLFNPTDFDADQIVAAARSAGMSGLILTAKHHDGFCLWPTQTTEHCIRKSPWQNGKGDVVRELSEACRRNGMKFGVYVSPWDRNHAEYGKPAYVEALRSQIRELLTGYGPIFEIWFDGANGGSGYYGGANQDRKVDRARYYGWEETFARVRELQPDCVIYSDIGPDIRWVSDGHRGLVGDPCWATFTPKGLDGNPPGIGASNHNEGRNGHRDGQFWIPGEDPMSIRPGWFYHADQKPRPLDYLVNLWFNVVGKGANLNLNLAPDQRGQIPDADVRRCQELGDHLRATFATNLAAGAALKAGNVRGGAARFSPTHLLDGDRDTYWATDQGVDASSLIVTFTKPTTFNVVDIREHLPLGQRVENWALDQWSDGAWTEFAAGKAVGSRRLWRGENIQTRKVRLRVDGPVCPALSELGLYLEPELSGLRLAGSGDEQGDSIRE